MTRYKGLPKAARTELEFQHHVNIVIPPGSLDTRLDATYEFHARWCFADSAIAESFASEFK